MVRSPPWHLTMTAHLAVTPHRHILYRLSYADLERQVKPSTGSTEVWVQRTRRPPAGSRLGALSRTAAGVRDQDRLLADDEPGISFGVPASEDSTSTNRIYARVRMAEPTVTWRYTG